MSRTPLLQHIHDPPQCAVLTVACSKLFLSILPSAYIAIGTVYLDECPRQPFIPIYLIVMGVFSLALSLFCCLPSARGDEQDLFRGACIMCNLLVSVFLFCWLIAGSVYIYSIYEPNYNKNATQVSSYCNKTLYLFAFWTTPLVYCFIVLFLLSSCCFLFCTFRNFLD